MTSVIILLSIVLARVFAKDCYNLDGSIAIDHLPCVGNAANTHCCPQGSTCLTNGLCLLEDDASLSTGSCTEKHWDELACFHSCTGDLGDDLNAPSTVYRCNGDRWCCSAGNNATSCCPTAQRTFALNQGSRALIQNGTSFNKGYTLVSIVDSSTSSSPASSTPPASAQPAAATSTGPSNSASRQTSTGSIPVATADVNSEKLKVGIGAGLGVGLPLLVALLASLFLLAWEKKTNRSLREGVRVSELDTRGLTTLPATKQYYNQPYPELPTQDPAVPELPNNRRGVPN